MPKEYTSTTDKVTRVPLRSTHGMQVKNGRELMNEPTTPKSAATSTVRGSQLRIPMRVRCAAWFAVLIFASLPALVFAQSPTSVIHVKILNIRNSTGTIACALFGSPEGFPKDFLQFATNIMIIKIRETQASCYFVDIPPGKYAMAVIHDENMNGKLDTNWIGVPKEGFGFSNNAEALLSAPSFSAASFLYDGQNIDMTMSLNY
jgi:uncharacterized protein (DUF2141 family)